VNLSTSPLTPAACEAFDPDELAARLDRLAELHARAEPPHGEGQTECFACGKLVAGKYAAARGWKLRPFPPWNFSEVYCPDCFAEWGWPESTTRAE
jgi:hypothetical protein